MPTRPATVLALLMTATLLTACGGDAYPIRTGNDYAVTTGGLGSMAGGTVGTAPEQQRNWDPQPAPSHPGPDVMPPPVAETESAPPAAAATADTVYTPPPMTDMPQAAPAPTYETANSTPACAYADMVGKPLTEDAVTKLVRQGKIVRELEPNGAATMDFQPNRVNITTDPNTGKVTAVTCG